MKTKIIAPLLLLGGSVFAATGEGESFESAKARYESGDIKAACGAIEKLYGSEMGNSSFDLYYAMCMADANRLDEAAAAFERVVITNPLNERAKLELSVVYFRLGQLLDAKAQLQDVLAAKPPQNVKEKIAALLKQIEQKQRRWSFQTTVFVAAGFDSNANSNPKKEELLDFIAAEYKLDKANVSAEQERASAFRESGVGFSALYDMGGEGRFWSTTAQLYTQNFSKSKEAGLIYSSVSSGPGIVRENFKISMPFGFENIDYGGRNLLNALSITPNAAMKIGDDAVGSVYVKLQKKLFIEDATKNSFVQEAGIGYFRKIYESGAGGQLFSSNEKKENANANRFLDRRSFGLKLNYSKEFMSSLSFGVAYLNKWSLFTDSASALGCDMRKDRYESVSAKISQEITKELCATLSASYVKNGSNYSPAKYEKSVYSLSLGYAF